MDFSTKFHALASEVESVLDAAVPELGAGAPAGPARVHAAMRHSLRAGGKRLRPVLVLAAAELGGLAARGAALPAAAAVECVHTYSLIHDDLPCMDDDDLRRGQPTCHRAFDEATALLAGDALLNEAFLILARAYADRPALCSALVLELADAASARRLVGGQMQDLLAERAPEVGAPEASAAELEFIHRQKTAALLEASLAMGGWVGGLSEVVIEDLRRAGRHLGLAFQIVDDVLDATGTDAELGKTAGKDARAGKLTCVSLYGLERARELAAAETVRAREALAGLPGDPTFLLALADRMLTRRA